MTEEMELETLDHRDFDAEIEEILDLIREKRYGKVRSTLIEYNAVDIAEILEAVEELLAEAMEDSAEAAEESAEVAAEEAEEV